jgi:hypothetical protein
MRVESVTGTPSRPMVCALMSVLKQNQAKAAKVVSSPCNETPADLGRFLVIVTSGLSQHLFRSNYTSQSDGVIV